MMRHADRWSRVLDRGVLCVRRPRKNESLTLPRGTTAVGVKTEEPIAVEGHSRVTIFFRGRKECVLMGFPVLSPDMP